MPGKKNDLEGLIAAWIDGYLDADGSQELQRALLESAAARSQFRKHSQLDAALHEVADSSGMMAASGFSSTARGWSPEQGQGAPTPLGVDANSARSNAVLQPDRPGRKAAAYSTRGAFSTRVFAWCGATAVGLLLALALSGSLHRGAPGEATIAQRESLETRDDGDASRLEQVRKPPAPVATLSFAKEALWNGSQLKVGEAILEGDTISLRQGKARISIGYGAEVVADGPCSLSFLASDRLHLHQGVVAIDVAPWAKGFTVVTHDMKVVDLGTTFTVSAAPDKATETAVLKGVVRVNASKAKAPYPRGLLITEGQQVSIDDSGSFDSIAVKDAKEVFLGLDFGVAEPYRPVALNNTGYDLSVGDEDLHWRVVAGPEGFEGPQYASVCPPERGYMPNSPDTSQWVSIADWQTAAPNSNYTFQTEFNLEGYDLDTIQLFGRFLADNGVIAVRVNGEPVQVQSWIDNVRYQPFGDPQFRFVNVTEGLVNGRNVIEIDVHNGLMRTGKIKNPRAVPNPMALRVEWYAFGRRHVLANGNRRVKAGVSILAPPSDSETRFHQSRLDTRPASQGWPLGSWSRRDLAVDVTSNAPQIVVPRSS